MEFNYASHKSQMAKEEESERKSDWVGRARGNREKERPARLCNRILREYDSRISSRRLFTYKLRNVTVFFIGAVAEVLRSEETLNGTRKQERESSRS